MSKAIYRSGKISKRQSFENTKYRSDKISNAKYRSGKISKRQNIAVTKYRTQNTEKVEHRKLKLRALRIKMISMLYCSLKYQAEHGGLESLKDNVGETIS